MLGSPIASNPYAILCFACLFTFVAAQFALTMFKYAVFLMLITAYSLILCQYRAPPPPDFTGSVRILYDRLVDVAIGVVVVLLLDLILPWCVNTASFLFFTTFTCGAACMRCHVHVGHEDLV